MQFSHLHVHTQFSLLDGAASISALYKKAAVDQMPALAITDHGNMFGAFKFVAEAAKHNVKPIVGCEFYLVADRHRKQFSKEDRDRRFHQLFLAKNDLGYQNLVKLCSLGFIEGMYSKYPRIDKELVLQYHEGLIATTCCIGASVPKAILQKGEAEGEKEFKWWLDLFGEDYYVELQRHDIPEQNIVNEVLLKFAKKYNVKIIASNDSHYVDQKDWNAHDILLCLNTGEKKATPTIKEFSDDESSIRGTRFAFYNDQFYLKTTAEMSQLFSDIPESIDNTNEIVGKVDHLDLKRDILLPNFPLPEEFKIHQKEEEIKGKKIAADVLNQWEYLKHLTFEGAKKRYGEITPDVQERLDFELFTIKTMGFAGYFLIVSDFIRAGRDLGVMVGPGRGSAAGSAVAYCIGITNIDPIKYDLLFERFLNPERYSMPDIDTDFDDEGRQKVIDYVVDKYGKQQVAQIVTYGTMAAKMSIQDVARVLDLPLPESRAISDLVPNKPGISLGRVLNAPIDGDNGLKDKENLPPDEIEKVKKIRLLRAGNDLQAEVLKEAEILEGSVRGTGIHAAGIIIAPKDLTELIPIATSKESELYVTQFDGSVIENAGVIKMDFLGLKTLSIIRDAISMIKENHGVEIDIDNIPLNDPKTFELYQKGETNGTFQFESAGMQKHLVNIKPDKFEDLIAMNALYRPGPMEYIPSYVKRKHGSEKVEYDLADMEEYLAETYGITVYQEQVMLLSQKLAKFSKGKADVLRKAMGKKDINTLTKLKPEFMEGAQAQGHPAKVLEKIWTDWEAFASYAFNKSHSTCYALVAYQTGYLKAHYPAEYMASVLIHNSSNMDKISFFMEECRRMGIEILGPDVNESKMDFAVNKKGMIRFGLAAIKGVGESAVESIIEQRQKDGAYQSIFDFAARVNLRNVSRRVFESLALAGGFDCFDVSRASFMEPVDTKNTLVELAMKYGTSIKAQEGSNQNSLFGGLESGNDLMEPTFKKVEEYPVFERLAKEKELVGMYISGHPLDQFKYELRKLKNTPVNTFKSKPTGQEMILIGLIQNVHQGISKKGHPYGSFNLVDYDGSEEIYMNGDRYLKWSHMFQNNNMVLIKGKNALKYKDGDFIEFQISQIELLSNLSEKMITGIQIELEVQQINELLMQELGDIIERFPGSKSLKIKLYDTVKKVSLNLISTGKKVELSPAFYEELSKICEFDLLIRLN